MRSGVVIFPGSNCDRDMIVALRQITGKTPIKIWHKEYDIPNLDLIVIPGGFTFGDYLRCGALAARSPVITSIKIWKPLHTPNTVPPRLMWFLTELITGDLAAKAPHLR